MLTSFTPLYFIREVNYHKWALKKLLNDALTFKSQPNSCACHPMGQNQIYLLWWSGFPAMFGSHPRSMFVAQEILGMLRDAFIVHNSLKVEFNDKYCLGHASDMMCFL